MDPRQLRNATGMSQAAFAQILGTTQPAVAAYEAGRRSLSTEVSAKYQLVEMAFDGPVRTYGTFRGRPIELPDAPWTPAVPAEARIRLPVHLEWSLRRDRDLSNDEDRKAVYQQVLAEGKASDIRLWIDPDELRRIRPVLTLPRHLEDPVDEMLTRLAGQRAA